jgi:predicted RNA polymerase sigma factor
LQVGKTIETLYRSESGRVLATLLRLLGDLDLAEEAMHEAFATALELWPRTGIPEKPRPWLISTARFKAIDVIAGAHASMGHAEIFSSTWSCPSTTLWAEMKRAEMRRSRTIASV